MNLLIQLTPAVASALLSQVTLRGQGEALRETVKVVDAQGVTIATGPGADDLRTIAWDRVAKVEGPKGAAFADLSDTLWRARTRLVRGDVVSSEPIFEQQYEKYAGERGATTSMIAEALVRARMSRGATSAAVGPWLVFLACGGEASISRDERHAPGGYLETPPLPIDKETGLIPSLPPIWLKGPASAAFARTEIQGFGAARKNVTPADQKSAVLAALYQASAAFENGIGASMPEIPTALRADKAVRLISLMVSARISDDPARGLARRELERDLTAAAGKPWLEAWLRVAIARSYQREDQRESRLLAVGQFAHLPARLPDAAPFLTGLALAEMAIEMNQLGDTAAALALRDELMDHAPDHPALEMEPIRRWPRSHQAGGAAPTP